MTTPFESIARLDRLIHEPARLAIMTALASCTSADFLFLQRLTGLTSGNLTSHISKLEEAGLIQVEKQFVEKRPNTLVKITEKGKNTIESHWEQLEKLHKESQNWEGKK